MEYLAFALKYRPKNFDEVVGQAHVVASLRNAILKDRVHHAYIFSGPRGVGKTSLARILAKSLNCFEGPTPKPCGKCPSCAEIAKGRSLDIIEIDGASNRGIDEIRTLRENVKLSPAHSRYKIYIVDEVHMLTQEAFNALLKTLEEPPSHVKFIFATTHPYKVLPTILSRCQKFQFNLLPLEQIVEKLKKIAEAEKVKIKEELLYTIARAAEGSIRDAESLFDQLVPVVLEKGSLDDIFSFLGIVDEQSLNNMLKSLVEKDLTACLDFINKIIKDGKDLGIFLNALIEHLRNLLLAKVSLKNFNELSDISPQSKDFICELSKAVSIADVLKIIDSFIEAKDLSRSLNTVRIPLELALIKYSCNEKDLRAVSSKGRKAVDDPIPQTEKPQKQGAPVEPVDSGLEEIENFVTEEDNLPFPEPAADNKDKPIANDDLMLQPVKAKWKEIISHMYKTRAALSSHLFYARPVSSQGNIVVIAFSPKDSFHKESVEGAEKIKFIEGVISQFAGKAIGVKLIIKDLSKDSLSQVLEEDEAVQNAQAEENEANQSNSKEDDSFLNELLDTFDGKFHNDEQ